MIAASHFLEQFYYIFLVLSQYESHEPAAETFCPHFVYILAISSIRGDSLLPFLTCMKALESSAKAWTVHKMVRAILKCDKVFTFCLYGDTTIRKIYNDLLFDESPRMEFSW